MSINTNKNYKLKLIIIFKSTGGKGAAGTWMQGKSCKWNVRCIMYQFLPPLQQIECITKEHFTVLEANTRGSNHCTHCHHCARNDPDECFWLVKAIGMNMDGRMIRTGRDWQNNQVCHYLYQTFIHEEYAYLMEQNIEDNVDGCIGLPHMPLLLCLERYIKQQFPNEDGRPFIGFWSCHHRN